MSAMQSREQVLARLRELLLALPGVSETKSWGHPNFRTRKNIFVAFHEDRSGVPCIWIRVEPLAVALLADDPRILPSSHGARWVGVRADRGVDWRFVRELTRESYAAVAPAPRVSASAPARSRRARPA